MIERGRVPYMLVLVGLSVAVVVAGTAGVAVGSVRVPFGEVWGILLHRVYPPLVEPSWAPVRETIVMDVRVPRILLCGVVGAGLSVCGMALQALVRNPLADPMLLGVSSGATVGAVVVMVLNARCSGRSRCRWPRSSAPSRRSCWSTRWPAPAGG